MINNEKLTARIIIAISLLVPALVVVLFFIKPPNIEHSINIHFFPKFHAVLNSLTAISILVGFLFIKKKDIKKHRIAMLSAFFLSAIFLGSYVFYHSMSEPTPYGGEGFIKNIYYFVLITHIVLAALILPLILFTFAKALNNKIAQHKKLAKWTFPLWLYVAVSGVVVYLMLAPYY